MSYCFCTGMSGSELSKDVGNTQGKWRRKGRGAATFITGCGAFMVTDWASKEKGSRQPTVNPVKRRVFRMVSSSIQFAFGPLDALPHGGIQIRGLLKGLEPLRSIGVPPFKQKIDQGYLHQGRLLLLERIQNCLVNLGLPPVAAKSIESRQANIHARVVVQRVKESGKDLRIKLPVARAPSYALEPRAGRLLLQHGKHDQLLHAGEFRLHGNKVWGRRLRTRQTLLPCNLN